MLRVPRLFVAAAALVVCVTSYAAAEDAYFDIPLSELKITSGELPKQGRNAAPSPFWDMRNAGRLPWVVIDGREEAYVRSPSPELFVEGVVVRTSEAKDLSGMLVIPKPDGTGLQQVKFTVLASAANPKARETFNRTKQAHYERLRSMNLTGNAWFRHQSNEARKALRDTNPNAPEPVPLPNRQFQNESELQRSFSLFSGGRAVSENLQLDRELLARGNDESLVEIDTLEGITVTEIDWKEKVKDLDPQLDPLAKLIPSDQHVLFIPSIATAKKLVEQLNGNDTVLLRLAEARIENAGTFARYERQLGLTLDDLPTDQVATLALTGSDPYFRTGTDVAVLLETKQPAELAKLLQEKIQKSANSNPDLLSLVAELPGAVVVTNSQAQLQRLKSVQEKTASIASLDEYKFFRNRYPIGDKEETGFVFLSDPTIRRWCSPKWRIASGRRTRNAAVLAELQAQNAVAIVTDKVEPHTLITDLPLINPGELAITAEGVVSTGQGSLAWMTPIIEMPIQQVTKTEANAYNAWRDGYQRNWTGVFDPIGLRLIVADDKLAGDLTIMPLIAGSQYRQIMAISEGAKIEPGAGDPHGALAHVVVAINTQSPMIQQWNNVATNLMSGIVPDLRFDAFSWLGSSVSLYIDDDPIWKELIEMTPEQRLEFQRTGAERLPIGLHADVSSSIRLAGFLAGVTMFVERSAGGLTVWEPLKYREQSYVRVRAAEGADVPQGTEDFSIYYSPSPQGLIVTPNEAVLKRAIDRRLDRIAAAKEKPAEQAEGIEKPVTLPWLGSNLCLQVDRKVIELAVNSQYDQMQRVMQGLAWSNLPILNEWKRMFPDQDPVEVQERLWYARPICPGGGEYVWNAEWQTMESTVYGHPGEPRNGPVYPTALEQFQKGNFGVTFEEQGLRARAELLRDLP